MRTIAKVALLAIVILVLAACQPACAGARAPGQSLPPGAAGSRRPQPSRPSRGSRASIWPAPTGCWVRWTAACQLAGATVTLQFDPDGSANGSDGCNRFRTTYAQDGASLTFGQPVASTMMACPEPVMNQATAFAGRARRPALISPPPGGN